MKNMKWILIVICVVLSACTYGNNKYANREGKSHNFDQSYKPSLGKYITLQEIEVFKKHWLRVPKGKGKRIPVGTKVEFTDMRVSIDAWGTGTQWWVVKTQDRDYKMYYVEPGLQYDKIIYEYVESYVESTGSWGKVWRKSGARRPHPAYFKKLSLTRDSKYIYID